MKGERGFTLLELLMVVIIIGILAAIALPQYTRTTERARVGEALQMLAALRGAEQRWSAQNGGAFTGTVANLDVTPTNSATWTYDVTTTHSTATKAAAPHNGIVLRMGLR